MQGRPENSSAEPADARQIEQEMSTLLNELSTMARQISQQLDDRSARLETLIRAADDRIEKLQRASADRQAPPAEKPAVDEVPADPRHAQIYHLADQGNSPQEIARQLGQPSGEVQLILALRE